MERFAALALGFVWMISCASPTPTDTAPKSNLAVLQSDRERAVTEATGTNYIVSTQGAFSTNAAKKMYELKGNIIDAAVAASFTISVERINTGIGGGGFLLYRDAKTKKTYAFDFRERAPLKATEKMFLDKDGNVIPDKSVDGIFAVATPGMVKGLVDIHQRFGRLPLKTVIAPAIELAEKGLPVYPYLETALVEQQDVLKQYPASAAIFLKPDGSTYKVGETIVQKDLANTLRKIAAKGSDAFYKGDIAKAIVAESKRLGGLLTEEDFRIYKTKERTVVRGTYHDYEVVSMPPPSSGGTHVIEILNMLEDDPLAKHGYLSTASIHLTASAMQQSFADRAEFMGDPDFVKVPVKELTSKDYARSMRKLISDKVARSATEVKAGSFSKPEPIETTHLSLMDKEGNVVSTTQTINGKFGSGVVVPGTGIILNNEMDDFSAKPGVQNIYGAVGGTPNAIAPKKTPLSSMSPTIVLKNGIPLMAVGAPGGTRIITCVAQTILNYFEYKLPLYESVTSVRFHHQWAPDVLTVETPGLEESQIEELKSMGHTVKVDTVPCKVMATAREGNLLRGVSDPRDSGMSYGN